MTNIDNIRLIRSQLPFEVFEEQDLHLIWRELSLPAQHNHLSRLIKKGDIKKISRGLYVFDEFWRKRPLSKFIIANKLVTPSYISFESALSHYGLIPESVYATTSASVNRQSKTFETQFGDYSYDYIPVQSFPLEVERKLTTAGPELVASPLKALFDLTYSKRKHYNSLTDVENDLRIDSVEIIKLAEKLSLIGLEQLAESYKKKTCIALYEAIKKEMR